MVLKQISAITNEMNATIKKIRVRLNGSILAGIPRKSANYIIAQVNRPRVMVQSTETMAPSPGKTKEINI